MTAVPKPGRPIRDEQYKAAVRQLPCLLLGLDSDHRCQGWDDRPVDACHLGQHHSHKRADDTTTAPLCHRAHLELHHLAGPFSGWKKAEIKAWSAWAISATRAQVARLKGETS